MHQANSVEYYLKLINLKWYSYYNMKIRWVDIGKQCEIVSLVLAFKILFISERIIINLA